MPDDVEDLLRELSPQVLGTLGRRYGDFDAAEDAVQEALLAAATHWPRDGVPERPRGWLLQTAERRLVDQWRSEQSRRRREQETAVRDGPAPDVPDQDDTLVVLFLCCHPALTSASAIALTLRAVGGLTTAEIAKAFLVPESTMAQRISRAKRTVQDSGEPFALPSPAQRPTRLRQVLQVLYLIYNEGYTSSSGPALNRTDLADEAIRLARLVHHQLPDDPEVTGLLALMLLTDARRAARTDAAGELVPLAAQERSRWNHPRIAEGVALLDSAIGSGSVGEYQLQAAIAALHDRAPDAAATDWPQILALYGLLERITSSPVVTLNRAVAMAMVDGPASGLAVLDDLGDRVTGHRVDVVRAHLLEMAGDRAGAATHFDAAARRTSNLPEQHYLTQQAARLRSSPTD
ncbi:RNA polymerase sigma factor [Angustibacter luteus]|uniref:RNA polymerase sigma factor n=1 Tax=Angustibacter luteus TaxID=658456 RepID=A0ABW1JIN0_9ACTN